MAVALGIDTSTERGMLALAREGRPTLEAEITSDLSHSSHLVAALDRLLDRKPAPGNTGAAIGGLDCIGVGVGPGSYTGVRVGVAFAKGLAFALRLPLYGVCSLEAMAWACRERATSVCAFVDAKMGGVYWAAYRFGGDAPTVITPPTITPAADFRLGDPALVLVSPHLDRLRSALAGGVPARACGEVVEGWPSAAYVAERALARLMGGEKGDDPVQPYYLRASVAEIEHPHGLIPQGGAASPEERGR